MARISDELINQIKQQVDLVRLVGAQGYQVQSHGSKDKAIRCPFHDDATASCVITPSSNLYHCFGCGAAGSVIDWVMQTQGVSFRHAVEILQKDVSVLAAESDDVEVNPKAVKCGSTPKLSAPLAADADSQACLKQVLDYYHQTLKQSPEALDYLKQRGLVHPELIDTFHLGFSNRTLGYRLPQKNRQAGAELRGKLQRIGLLRASGHEHFNGSLVFPIMDEHGVVHEVYGRKLLNNLRKGTPKHTYLPGAHKGVWNIQSLAAETAHQGEVILCESLIDAMTFWVHGYRNVTASYGTNGFTSDHLAAFKQYHIKRVLIAYDRDDAGDKAADKLAAELMAQGFEVFRILFPQGLDANDYARQVQPAAIALGQVIRFAQWLGKGQAPQINTPTETGTLDIDLANAAITDFQAIDDLAAEQVELEAQMANEASQELIDTNEQTERCQSSNSEPIDTAPDAAPSASVMPPQATDDGLTHSDNDWQIVFEQRRYRIRGLEKNQNHEQLKINLLVSRDEHFHVDNLDMYSARGRHSFIKQASIELSVAEDDIKHDLGKLLLKLECLQDKQLKPQLSEEKVGLSSAERKAALKLLTSPKLMSRILEDFDTCGVIGEHTNKLVGYLAAVSRKLDKPLAVMVQSSSAAGKSSLMDAVLAMMPAEERIQFSAMTGQSLYYMGETNLKHKILAISEEEGAEQAAYALKLLQSEGEVSIASTGKNPVTGNLETQQYRVTGPVMLMMTTTAIDIDEELMNRCLVLSVNESREQTEAIHKLQRQRQTLKGLLSEQDKSDIITLHQNAQRLLRPLLVANPYAETLTFLSDKTRTRRDHLKYLTLIRTITLLHQYQRQIKHVTHHNQQLEYIEVTRDDIYLANQLSHEVFGRTLDELPPQTRKLLQHILQMVNEQCQQHQLKHTDVRFSRKQVRDYTGCGNTQLKIHLSRLEDMEYVLAHRGSRGQSYVYELLYQGEGQQGERFLQGLLNLNAEPTNGTDDSNPQRQQYDNNKSGQNDKVSPLSRAQVGGMSAAGRVDQTQSHSDFNTDLALTLPKGAYTPSSTLSPYHHSETAADSNTHAINGKAINGHAHSG